MQAGNCLWSCLIMLITEDTDSLQQGHTVLTSLLLRCGLVILLLLLCRLQRPSHAAHAAIADRLVRWAYA